ncbi:DUF397 domain-containing protein [Streptomyces sp. NPDC096198]|uniref:DUF397 domain-containing protein n=1 Tax=Streptomyces sp. NPDC096198 TaxID=3366080 RepID=UPI0037F1A845
MTDHTKLVPSTEFTPEGLWYKSSYSDQAGGNCLEVAETSNAVRVRDSKRPGGSVLTFTPAGFVAFAQFAAELEV